MVPSKAVARPGDSHRRLAARSRHLRRLVPLPPRQQPGRARLRRRPRLQQPLAEPVRGDAALEDAPGDPQDARGRQAPRLRRARDRRRRHPQPAEDGVSRRRLRRLRSRLPQRQPDQGQPCRHQDRHARRRSRVRGAGRRAQQRRADRLPGRVRQELAARRARALAQLQAVVQEGPHDRDADDRHRAVAAAQARLQGAALDAAPRQGRPPLPEAGGRVPEDRLSQARQRAHLRPAVERVRQQHQPCRGAAGAPDAEGRRACRCR